MKTKKIWIGAIIFGILTTSVLYFAFFSSSTGQSAEPAATEQKVKEPVKKKKLEENVDLQPLLPIKEGKRAISIEVNTIEGVSGHIKPGAHVDLVSVMRPPEEAQPDLHEAATLLLQDVRVLGLGHASEPNEKKAKYGIVTLEVDPYEGLALGLATKGDLYLLLRKPGDQSIEPEKTHVHEEDLHKGVFRR